MEAGRPGKRLLALAGEMMVVWAQEGAVEGESDGLAWEYLHSRFWAGGKERARVPCSTFGTAFSVLCTLELSLT